jgi:Xaa-Pro aminopeptidase
MKIKEFQRILQNKDLDFVLFYQTDIKEPNMLYFAGYSGYGALVIPAKSQAFLVVPKMELLKAKQLFRNSYVLRGRLFEYTVDILKRKNIRAKKIGINKKYFSLYAFRELKKNFKAKFIDVSEECANLRMTKTDKEILTIRKACKISDNILRKCIKEFKSFHTESDVASFLEYEANRLGCDAAFPTIVASGRHAEMPHYKTTNSKLLKGFCIIDFGIVYKNYCTDTSRTLYIGKPNDEEIELYNLVLNAQKRAINAINMGKATNLVHMAAVNALGKFGKYFVHSIGHGLGIEVHEKPVLTENCIDKFKERMVFTVEPGIYFNKMGIRIEDDILLKNGRVEFLTKAKHQMR